MCVTKAVNDIIKVPKNLRSSLILYPVSVTSDLCVQLTKNVYFVYFKRSHYYKNMCEYIDSL